MLSRLASSGPRTSPRSPARGGVAQPRRRAPHEPRSPLWSCRSVRRRTPTAPPRTRAAPASGMPRTPSTVIGAVISRGLRSPRVAGAVGPRPPRALRSGSITARLASAPTPRRATSTRRPHSCATSPTPPAPLPWSPIASVAMAVGAVMRPTGTRRVVADAAVVAASAAIATATAPRARATRAAASSRARTRCSCPSPASSTSPTTSTPICAPPATCPVPRTSTSRPTRSRTTVCGRATPSRAGSARAGRPPTRAVTRAATTVGRTARAVRSTTRW